MTEDARQFSVIMIMRLGQSRSSC